METIMQCEILMIGTELLLGQIVDTNAAYIGAALLENGIPLYQKTTVGDNPGRIRQALDDAMRRSGIVLTSGGLGPTEDDITRECIAELTGRPLEFREDLYQQLRDRFARMRRPMSENNKRQAYAPQGAIAIPNPNGTAPGLIVEDARGTILCMPGVPKELYAMLDDSVIPYLRKKLNIQGLIRYRVLKVCGVGESRVDEAIADLITSSSNPKIGLLASIDAVRIRISARADTPEEADALIASMEARVQERMPGWIMGAEPDTIESVVDRLLRAHGWTLSLAETMTGGMLAQRLAASGSTQFAGAMVERMELNETRSADQIAAKAREHFHSECALGVTVDPQSGAGTACFLTPGGASRWEVSCMRLDEFNQTRVAVVCMENIRRKLAGISI